MFYIKFYVNMQWLLNGEGLWKSLFKISNNKSDLQIQI
jgi:hypothetical protein